MKGKASQKESPGVLADSNGGRLSLNTGALSGRGGGAGDGPPEYQFIRLRRDNPKGPENKGKRLLKWESVFPMDRGFLGLKDFVKIQWETC